MARFDMKFPPGSAARKEKVARVQNDYERQLGNFTLTFNQFADQFQHRCSQFQIIAAIIDLVIRPPLLIHNRPGTSNLQRGEGVSDVSSCSWAIYLRRSKRQDLSTSGSNREGLYSREIIPIW